MSYLLKYELELDLTAKNTWREDLYTEHASTLMAVAYRYTNNVSDAEDVVHDSFIFIFENIHKYRGEGSFEGWIRRIVVNQSINRFKRNIQFKELDDNDDFTDEEEEDYLKDKPTPLEIESAIKSLPTGYKEVFNMFLIDGLSYKEIADILKISEVTSRTQYLRAKKLLKKKLSKNG